MRSLGLCNEHARDVAETLVATSLWGIDTHGVRLLPTYVRELEGGRANKRPLFRISGTLPSAGVFHADNALGVVAANAAMREAIRRASSTGIAALAVRDSNHFGAAGYYARLAARHDQIGLVFSNSDALVAADGGQEAINGTNPIAMAAPGLNDDGFFLDMATSEFAYSRLLSARGIAAGAAHRPREALPPLGGYKGQGLGTMVQILCALLASMPFDTKLTHLYEPPYDSPRQISHFMVAIELHAFVAVDRFRSRVTELLERFRLGTPIRSSSLIVAGDLEAESQRKRSMSGIPLDESEWSLLSPYLDGALIP